MEFVLKVNPRVFGKMLERKIDSLIAGIKPDYLELDFLPFFDKILGARNVSPAHIVDVQKPVKTAKIDKRAKAGKTFYRTLYRVADSNGFKKF